LKNDGNFEGEAANQPGNSSVIGDYPEIRDPARHFPVGRTDDFQRHRVRVWGIYNLAMNRFGTLTSSLMWRYEGAQAYSLAATGVPITDTQRAILGDLGYQSEPNDQTIYFGRGTELFDDYSLFDASFNYQIPVWQDLRPWVKLDLFNVTNNDTLIGYNTTVLPDPNSPLDELGLPTGYIKGANFGKNTQLSHNPIPRELFLSVGFRF